MTAQSTKSLSKSHASAVAEDHHEGVQHLDSFIFHFASLFCSGPNPTKALYKSWMLLQREITKPNVFTSGFSLSV